MPAKYRSPNGRYIDDVNEYLAEWHRLIDPLQSIGFRVHGFDPGFMVSDRSVTGGNCFDLPTWAAKRIVRIINKNKEEEVEPLVVVDEPDSLIEVKSKVEREDSTWANYPDPRRNVLLSDAEEDGALV